MYNMLLIEDEIMQSHFLVNTISKEIPEIRIYNIASTGLDAINTIKEEMVDIILLDLKLPDMSGIEIIDFITRENIVKYKKSILVVTAEMDLLSKIVRNPYIFSYNSKSNGIDPIIQNIKDLIEDKQENDNNIILIQDINNELNKLHYNFKYIGTRYLAECIYEAYHKNNKYDINLNKEIYPIISRKYNKTISSIKTNINQATTNMYFDIEEKVLFKFFKYNISCKPKPKDVILKVIENLEQRRS